MRGLSTRLRRVPPATLVVLCLFTASAAIVQTGLSWNDTSHYAQTRALAAGTPVIDRWADTTGDRAVFRGHFYSDKAPGLAFLTAPVERVARSIAPSGSVHQIHALAVVGSLLPVALLLLLIARVADGYSPRTGAVVAVALGLGTLLLPFGTLYFSHPLATLLG